MMERVEIQRGNRKRVAMCVEAYLSRPPIRHQPLLRPSHHGEVVHHEVVLQQVIARHEVQRTPPAALHTVLPQYLHGGVGADDRAGGGEQVGQIARGGRHQGIHPSYCHRFLLPPVARAAAAAARDWADTAHAQGIRKITPSKAE